MTMPLMKCGCVATGTDRATGKPVCVACMGIVPGADEVADTKPSLEGRTARCACGRTEPSSYDLPFFEFRGPGSPDAARVCKHCRYHEVAHIRRDESGDKHLSRVCHQFEPHGPFEFDGYYCGHGGFD